MDFTQLLQRFGIELTALIAVAWFFYRELWPFIRGMIERAYAERQEQLNKFIGTVDKMTEQMTTQREQTMATLHTLTEKLDDLCTNVSNLALVVSTLTSANHTAKQRTGTTER